MGQYCRGLSALRSVTTPSTLVPSPVRQTHRSFAGLARRHAPTLEILEREEIGSITCGSSRRSAPIGARHLLAHGGALAFLGSFSAGSPSAAARRRADELSRPFAAQTGEVRSAGT